MWCWQVRGQCVTLSHYTREASCTWDAVRCWCRHDAHTSPHQARGSRSSLCHLKLMATSRLQTTSCAKSKNKTIPAWSIRKHLAQLVPYTVHSLDHTILWASSYSHPHPGNTFCPQGDCIGTKRDRKKTKPRGSEVTSTWQHQGVRYSHVPDINVLVNKGVLCTGKLVIIVVMSVRRLALVSVYVTLLLLTVCCPNRQLCHAWLILMVTGTWQVTSSSSQRSPRLTQPPLVPSSLVADNPTWVNLPLASYDIFFVQYCWNFFSPDLDKCLSLSKKS